MGELGKTLLVIDSDQERATQLREWLAGSGHSAVYGARPQEWISRLDTGGSDIDVALLGPCPGTTEQTTLYKALRLRRPHLPIILYGDSSLALFLNGSADAFVRTIRLPVDRSALGDAVTQAMRYAEERALASGRNPELFRSLVGKSEGVRHVRQLIERVAKSDSTYCLEGIGDQAGKFMIDPWLRQRVTLEQINLTRAMRFGASFDVIFLRNVLIYFDTATKRQVIANVREWLKPGGHLFVGHSESLQGVVKLAAVRPSIYRNE